MDPDRRYQWIWPIDAVCERIYLFLALSLMPILCPKKCATCGHSGNSCRKIKIYCMMLRRKKPLSCGLACDQFHINTSSVRLCAGEASDALMTQLKYAKIEFGGEDLWMKRTMWQKRSIRGKSNPPDLGGVCSTKGRQIDACGFDGAHRRGLLRRVGSDVSRKVDWYGQFDNTVPFGNPARAVKLVGAVYNTETGQDNNLYGNDRPGRSDGRGESGQSGGIAAETPRRTEPKITKPQFERIGGQPQGEASYVVLKPNYKSPINRLVMGLFLACPEGFEPTTFWFVVR